MIEPFWQDSTAWEICLFEVTAFPSTETITSPILMPASLAGFLNPSSLSMLLSPTTMTPSVNILMPNGVPQGMSSVSSRTWTFACLMGSTPNSFKSTVWPSPAFIAGSDFEVWVWEEV